MQVSVFQWKILVAFLFDSSSKNIIFQWYWPTKVFLFVANDGGALRCRVANNGGALRCRQTQQIRYSNQNVKAATAEIACKKTTQSPI